MINRSTDGKIRVLSLSYGKDSMACLGAIEQLGWPLDRIVHAEVWATDTIPADLPPMVEFKAKADAIIKERWGFEVEHYRSKWTYQNVFYAVCGEQLREARSKYAGQIYGFPFRMGQWCNSRLKVSVLSKIANETKGAIQYLGIAADESIRIERHTKEGIELPLVQIGWEEAYCRQWCEDNDLLSPIYTSTTRGGCWFCHNQSIGQLRLLRKNYPELWQLLLKWDNDSPVSFHADGHTVHDFDKRFEMEDRGWLDPNSNKFRWEFINDPFYTMMYGETEKDAERLKLREYFDKIEEG